MVSPSLNVAVGEPQHPTPPILTQALAAHSTEWNRYPPLAGTDAWGRAVVDWLTRRFELPKGALDRTRHVLPLAGSREGLYMAAETVIPRHKNDQRPALIAAFTRVRGYASAAVGIPVQAAAAALWSDEHHVIDNRARYNDKFRLAQDRLGAHFGDVIPPGGFFLWLKVGDGEAMARRLWVEQGLRVLPGAYLSHAEPGQRPLGHDYIRFALVHDLPMVAEALDRLLMVTDSTPR